MNIARMLYGFVMKEETPELHAFIESHCRNLIAEPIRSLHCFCNCRILRKAVENAISSDCWLCFCLLHKWSSTLHYVGWLGSAEGAWVVVQVYESNHSANNLAGSICGPIQMLLPLLYTSSRRCSGLKRDLLWRRSATYFSSVGM